MFENVNFARAPVDVTPSGEPTAAPATDADRRINGLDGLRGVACLSVVISHYFGELPHGIRPMMVGWIAVDIFFVLSGFLIGRLILDKRNCGNFFAVFYIRRILRLFPAYIVTVAAVFLLLRSLPPAWTDATVRFPIGAYLAGLQGFWMVSTNSIGAHWLAPTWTLAVEEHFYLIMPAVIIFSPRRFLAPALISIGAAAIIVRTAATFGGPGAAMAALVLLPGRADLLAVGVLAALLNASDRIAWPKLLPVLRIAPILSLLIAGVCKVANGPLFTIVGPTLVGGGCAALILCIVRGAPEAGRFNSPVLRFFADNGYCLYLTHLPVLGLMHGFILGQRPDLQTPEQWAVTLLALPACILVSLIMTKSIEEPFMAYGRRWKWGTPRTTATVAPSPIMSASAPHPAIPATHAAPARSRTHRGRGGSEHPA